jgi:integrase
MPIRRHGKGWEVRIRRVKPEISRSFRSYRDAAEFERRALQRLSDHRVGRTPQYTLEEALDRWLGNEAKALRSFDNLQDKVRAIYPFVRGRRLSEVGEVCQSITQEGVSRGLRPATINRRLAILRRVARLAHRKWDWMDVDLAAKITLLPGEEPRYVQASPEQADKLLKAAKGKTRQAILWAVLTGLRTSELLRVERHHFKDGSLMVLEDTKTGNPRAVPLQRDLSASNFPWGLTSTDVEKRFRQARSKAGMPWLQFRDLRRTFGSWIVQKTKSLKAAQELLGHSTIAITAKHYAHLLDEDRRKAIRTLPSFAGTARGRAKRKKAA